MKEGILRTHFFATLETLTREIVPTLHAYFSACYCVFEVTEQQILHLGQNDRNLTVSLQRILQERGLAQLKADTQRLSVPASKRRYLLSSQ